MTRRSLRPGRRSWRPSRREKGVRLLRDRGRGRGVGTSCGSLPLLRGHCRERSLYPWDASSDSPGVTALPSVPGGAYRPWLGTPKAQRRGSGGSSVRGKVVSDSPAERRQVPQARACRGWPAHQGSRACWELGGGVWDAGLRGGMGPGCLTVFGLNPVTGCHQKDHRAEGTQIDLRDYSGPGSRGVPQ